jgi:hypothetical protein
VEKLIISGDLIQPSVGSDISILNGTGFAISGNRVGQIGTDYGAFKGNVVQCRITRYDTRTSIATGTSVDGIEITALRVSITPKFASSMILCMFQLFGEGVSTHEYVMRVFKNGAIATGTYAGFNTDAGNQHWSGMAMALPYEGDYNSTPHQSVFYYHDFPNTTNAITYAPGIKDGNGSNYTYYINRPVGSTGQGSYEVGVSFSIAWEIAQ